MSDVGKARLLAVYPHGSEHTCDLTGWELAPEKPEKPEWLNDMWMNVYPDGEPVAAAAADGFATSDRIGRVCIGTGEWVPCKGKEVLS